MELGVIHGGRDSIKWIPKEKDRGGILSYFTKGINLLEWYDSKLESCYCKECNKIKFGISSDDYYFLVGTDSSNNSTLRRKLSV